MKYIYSIFIDNVIQDFKQDAITAKTQYQMLVIHTIQYVIVQGVKNSKPNISLAYTVLEGGGVKRDGDVHAFIVIVPPGNSQPPALT
jgi:hypothetical protein